MDNAMEYSIYTIGFLFCVMVLCGLILIFVERTISEIKRRKQLELKLRLASYTNELSRWCGYEFPHVELTANAVWKLVNGDAYLGAYQIRKQLRAEIKAKEPTK